MSGASLAAWITDGSLPVFADTWRLRATHPALLGLKTRYEGFVDPATWVGKAELAREQDDDQLFVEAEWALLFPGGTERLLQKPALFDERTPVILQGFVEGKWMNRLLGTRAWRPASIANNVLAEGPGIATTLAAIEGGETEAEVRIVYTARDGVLREFSSRATDLRGHNIPGLVREVFRICREHDRTVEAINLGAVGERSAVVNERPRIRRAARFGRLPLPNPANLADPHRAKERLVAEALGEGIDLPPGGTATLEVRDGAGAPVGSGTLTLAR